MTVQIIRGNALHLPLADESVDLVCTSPPYFGLRSYQDGGQHYAGQLGSEPTPAEFVAALLAATREMVRVLKPSGSIWVNLGDKYSGNEKGTPWTRRALPNDRTIGGSGYGNQNVSQPRPRYRSGLPPKSLMGVPWRYAIACIDQLGLILRAEIIWNKPNGLPESVTDRVRRSHEQWFHFVRQPRYYSAVDEIRDTYSDRVQDRQRYAGRDIPPSKAYAPGDRNDPENSRGILGFGHNGANPLGKLPGSVWTIPTEPLTIPEALGVDHFAAFPTEMPRRIILGWTPAGICEACGQGRRPVADSVKITSRPGIHVGRRGKPLMDNGGNQANEGRAGDYDTRITGYVCGCTPHTDRIEPQYTRNGEWMSDRLVREYHFDRWTPAPTTPAVVLDPFGGTGTTALVADVLGRNAIHIDLSSDYNRLAAWRCNDPNSRAKAARVDKPPPVIDGQLSLLDGGAA